MKAGERRTLHLSLALVGGTGVVYGALRYFGQVQGEFGWEPHPAQGSWQHLHVLTAPLLVFMLGMAMRGHGFARLKQPATLPGRSTGLYLALIGVPLVLGGYGIQVVTGALSRTVLAWVHGVTGALLLGLYGVHAVYLRRGHSAQF